MVNTNLSVSESFGFPKSECFHRDPSESLNDLTTSIWIQYHFTGKYYRLWTILKRKKNRVYQFTEPERLYRL